MRSIIVLLAFAMISMLIAAFENGKGEEHIVGVALAIAAICAFGAVIIAIVDDDVTGR